MEEILEQEGRNWIEYVCTQIIDLQKTGEYERALTLTNDGLDVWCDNPILLYFKSILFLKLIRPGKAIRTLRSLRKVIPFDYRIYEIIGRNLLSQGYYHATHDELSHFDLMTERLAGESKITLHICRASIGNTEPVLTYCDNAIEFYSKDPEAGQFLAIIHALKVLCLLQDGKEDNPPRALLRGLLQDTWRVTGENNHNSSFLRG